MTTEVQMIRHGNEICYVETNGKSETRREDHRGCQKNAPKERSEGQAREKAISLLIKLLTLGVKRVRAKSNIAGVSLPLCWKRRNGKKCEICDWIESHKTARDYSEVKLTCGRGHGWQMISEPRWTRDV